MKNIIIFMFTLLAFLNVSTATSIEKPKDALNCTFTEPFFNIFYNAATGEVVYTGVENYNETTGEFIPMVLTKDGSLDPVVAADEDATNFYSVFGSKFELKDENGKVLMTLVLDMNGTDGMSDSTYPFSAVYQGFHGGCETRMYPSVNSVDIFEGLSR